MTDSELLGLVGGAFSATGVLLALVGTSKIRAAVDQIKRGLNPRQAKAQSIGGKTAFVSVTSFGRGKVGPGPEGWTDDEWHAQLDKRIDQLVAEFDKHGHPSIEKRLDRLAIADAETRAQTDSKLADLAANAGASERWNIWGLVFAGVGALLQVAAVVIS